MAAISPPNQPVTASMTSTTGQHHVIPSDLEAARQVQEEIETAVKPFFDEGEAFAIKMAVESYRSGKVLYFDERNERVTDRPIQVQAKA